MGGVGEGEGGLKEVVRVVFDDEDVMLLCDLVYGFPSVEWLGAACGVLAGGDGVEEFGAGAGLVVRPVVEGLF